MAQAFMTGPGAGHVPILRVHPTKGWAQLKLGELWQYRELIYFLVWRDLKVRYKQTVLGAAWAVLQPLFTMLVFTLFLGRLAKIPSDGVPYSLFTYAALSPWMFFAGGINMSSASLVASANMIKKVYFPRLALPVATVLSGIVDFLLSFSMLIGMMGLYRLAPTMHILWLPFLFLLALTTTVGAGIWLSALNVRYRDVRYVVPFLVQFWMFATPVAYPSSLLKEPWRTLYGLNPMAGVVEGFRWALLGTNTAPGPMIFVSGGAAVALLLTGCIYFRNVERTFADIV